MYGICKNPSAFMLKTVIFTRRYWRSILVLAFLRAIANSKRSCPYVCSFCRLCAGLLARSLFGRSCDRSPRHRFFLVSLCL